MSDDNNGTERVMIPRKIADLIRGIGTVKGPNLVISLEVFEDHCSDRSRSSEADRVAALRIAIGDHVDDDRVTLDVAALSALVSGDGSVYPTSAIANPSYWSGAGQPGAGAALALGFGSKLAVAFDASKGAIVPTLTLTRLSVEKRAELTAKREAAEAARKAAAAAKAGATTATVIADAE